MDFEAKSRMEKAQCANNDFELLLSSGNIAFYKGCEVTQIFLKDKESEQVINYFSLFVFDEVETVYSESNYLLPKLKTIDKKYSLGILRKRISIEKSKQIFKEIQSGKLDFDGSCNISNNFILLPKTYVPTSYGEPIFLNSILKPNYWGDNYIIEFFDESKNFFSSDKKSRTKIDTINNIIKENRKIKIDLSKVFDRIGNIIFQFPITVLKTQINSERDSISIRFRAQYHPLVSNPKNLHIEMVSMYDDVITGFNTVNSDSFVPDEILKVGDDNNLTTVVFDSNLILHNSKVNFLRGVNIEGRIGMQYSEPRTMNLKNGENVSIDLFSKHNMGSVFTHNNDYFDRILKRKRNNEVLSKSGDYKVLKKNQKQEALEYIREKIKNSTIGLKEICLWDPYLTAFDIMETLYFEDTGIPFRCISSYQTVKKIKNSEEKMSFEKFCKEQKECFENNSNNLRVKLKFLVQHDSYGWKFHDRFLILVPIDSTTQPDVYSLGTSINNIGNDHHIIQKVTNSSEILNNFEELWKLLDNGECLVAEF